jgi:hypothetical protein
MPIGAYNFDAESHQKLYNDIHGITVSRQACSVQTSAGDETDTAWLSFRAVMGDAKSNVETALQDAGVQWVGTAGEAFTGSMAPLVQWAEDARVAGVASHNSYQAQQSYYTGAKNSMPEPVAVTSMANSDYWGIPAGLDHLVGGQTDQDLQEQ